MFLYIFLICVKKNGWLKRFLKKIIFFTKTLDNFFYFWYIGYITAKALWIRIEWCDLSAALFL